MINLESCLDIMEDKKIESTKSKVVSGLFWSLMQQLGTQGIQFIVQIILARLLLPKEYGIIALITIFIAISNVFVQSGFSTALIQKKYVDEQDLSSVFFLSTSVAVIFYILLFYLAPFIASFYDEPQLIMILRVMSLTLFIGAVNSIQTAIVYRAMQFKRFFFSSLGGILGAGVVGIIMAYMGFGVWALVANQLTNQFLITMILWFTIKWRPRLVLSFDRLKGLFSYSWKLLCSSLIETIYNNVYGLVIFKLFNAEMLGYYNKGSSFPSLLVANIDGSIQSVMLPALSANQDFQERVKQMVRRSIVTSSFIVFPMMVGLAVVAEPLVKILLTDKWLPCVPFLQLMCITYAFWPVHTANLQAIKAMGRSDIFLKIEVIKKCIGIGALCASIPFGIYVMVGFQPIVSLISSIINAFPNKELLNYSFKEQWKDIMPSMLLSLIMGAGVYGVKFIGFEIWLTLIVQIVVGIILYIGLAYIFKLECFRYLLNTIKELLKQKTIGGSSLE